MSRRKPEWSETYGMTYEHEGVQRRGWIKISEGWFDIWMAHKSKGFGRGERMDWRDYAKDLVRSEMSAAIISIDPVPR